MKISMKYNKVLQLTIIKYGDGLGEFEGKVLREKTGMKCDACCYQSYKVCCQLSKLRFGQTNLFHWVKARTISTRFCFINKTNWTENRFIKKKYFLHNFFIILQKISTQRYWAFIYSQILKLFTFPTS